MVPGWGREPFCGDCRITSKRRVAIAWEALRKSVASTCPCRRQLVSMCWYACNTTDSDRKRPERLRLNWGLRRASRYLWRLARKVSGSGVRACEHWTAGRRLSSTWITKQSWTAISVTVSMRLSLRKRREDIAYAPISPAYRPVGMLRSIVPVRTSVAHQGVKQNFRYARRRAWVAVSRPGEMSIRVSTLDGASGLEGQLGMAWD